MTGGKWGWLILGAVVVVCYPFIWVWKTIKKLVRWIKDN